MSKRDSRGASEAQRDNKRTDENARESEARTSFLSNDPPNEENTEEANNRRSSVGYASAKEVQSINEPNEENTEETKSRKSTIRYASAKEVQSINEPNEENTEETKSRKSTIRYASAKEAQSSIGANEENTVESKNIKSSSRFASAKEAQSSIRLNEEDTEKEKIRRSLSRGASRGEVQLNIEHNEENIELDIEPEKENAEEAKSRKCSLGIARDGSGSQKKLWQKAQLSPTTCFVAMLTCAGYLIIYLVIGPDCLASLILALAFILAFTIVAYIVYSICERENWFNMQRLVQDGKLCPCNSTRSGGHSTPEEKQFLKSGGR